MTTTYRLHTAISFAAFLLVGQAANGARAQQPTGTAPTGTAPAAIPTPEAVTRFSASLVATIKKEARPLRVTARTLIVPNDVTTDVDHSGDAIVHVRAGELVAVIDGKPTRQDVDTSFVVANGAKLTIRTERDSVVVQIIDVASGTATGGSPP